MNNDGICEILLVLRDCLHVQWLTGQTATNTNWSAAWCIQYTPEDGFLVAEGQVFFQWGTMNIGSAVVPDGIWLSDSFEYYLLEDGKIVLYAES